ncbi:hypothetical protein [Aestuariibius sp. HNIBRBA575]|uniref:hypothetical protein n=1 Tax=Aestuariibius sp. HNIBRBA575 TaxID=3233343 RepID=UPI0034A3EBBC
MSTLDQLDQVDPLTADPAGFEVALDMPDGVDVIPNSAMVQFAAQRVDTGDKIGGDFVLQRRNEGAAIFYIAHEDLPEMRNIQRVAQIWEANHADQSEGSLSVDMKLCQRQDLLDMDDTVSASIRLIPDGAFLPLVRNARLSDFLAEADVEMLPRCE